MRIVAGIEYDGINYHGWQHQENLATIQNCLEKALSIVADHPVKLICAGRTDAGVHALEQIVHFDTDSVRSAHAWIFGGNSNLPKDICIHWAKKVDSDFHARFSAIARTYRYHIFNNPTPPAISRDHIFWYPFHELDAEKIQLGANFLLGKHDFTSFRGKRCQARSAERFVEHIKVTRAGATISIEIKANAFLQHMVRNIIGTLIEIGATKKEPIWAKEVLEAENRAIAGTTAPPQGLYLTKVFYPPTFKFSDF